jgi:8-oxo-dGTP diphosphatase
MKTYTYHYPKPSVTTDCILLKKNTHTEILLIKRKHDPFIGKWALPGGFVEIDEDLKEGAKRELIEETGIENIQLTQFKTYGKPGRDPRGRTISVVYSGYVEEQKNDIKAGDDAAEVSWFDLGKLPALAFDHKFILEEFIAQLG